MKKNNKLVAYIHWGLCVGSLLVAALISDTGTTKQVVLYLILAVIWFLNGLIYWKRGK